MRDTVLDDLFAQRGIKVTVARKLGITPQAVGKWKRVPPERVIEVEQATGVSRHRLRPDLYPR